MPGCRRPPKTPAGSARSIGTGIFGARTVEETYRALLLEDEGRAPACSRCRAPCRARRRRRSAWYMDCAARCSASARPARRRTTRSRRPSTSCGSAAPTSCSPAAPTRRWSLPCSRAGKRCARRRARPAGRSRPTATGWCSAKAPAMAVLETYEHAARARRADPGRARRRRHVGRRLRHRRTDRRRPGGRDRAPAWPMPGSRRKTSTTSTRTAPAPSSTTSSRRKAIRRVFGNTPTACRCPRPSRCTRHCMGASGALELIACVMAIREGIIPPTVNYRREGPGMRPRRDAQRRQAAQGARRDQQRLRLRRHQRGDRRQGGLSDAAGGSRRFWQARLMTAGECLSLGRVLPVHLFPIAHLPRSPP